MSHAQANRNLLVGVLALQMDFVDRDSLISAMQGWMGDKDKSLEDVFLEQDAISKDTAELLSGLVDKHIAMHQGDPEKSLASANMGPELRDELSQLGDDQLDRTLLFVSGTKATGAPAVDPHATVVHVPPESQPGMRYRTIRLHDQGGLGTVSLALDEELNREVALKEIRPRLAGDDAARERFTLEAEITGGLEHPGIVPVYGFGHYEDGRPFYAMRFIRGDNLEAAITRYHDPDRDPRTPGARALEFRRLLRRLVDVCYAIQYAHCRGVLHRDLKPGNIMLGMYGETLVVDWGLARASQRPESPPLTNESPLQPIYSSGSDQTRQGTQLGTPAFMPPEQADGRLDLVDARSDVYSLGATLYVLLTGQRAFNEQNIETVLAKVRRGDFPPPRRVHPATPRALEAICLKAMERDPADRYDSADALAKDLESWLADEPVSGWHEPFSIRLRRWLKHHRTLVASAAAAAGAALLILSATVGLLNAAKNRETRQRQRAEQNLSLAKQAVDTMLTEVASQELENVPQMEATRQRLLAKARDFYREFRAQTPEDPTLRLETAVANKRLGDIFRMMGAVDQSRLAYENSVEQLEGLHKEFPDEPVYQQQLANALNFLGVLFKKYDRPQALVTYDRTIRLQSDLNESHPQHPIYRQELARSHYNRGILRTTDASTAAAAESDFRQAIDHLQFVLENEHPDADLAGCRQELARCYSNLAILDRAQGRLSTAKENFEAAISTALPLTEQFPDQLEYKKEIALYYNNLGNLLIALGDPDSLDAAKLANNASLNFYSRVAAAVPEVRSDLGNIRHSRGVIRAKSGNHDEARGEFEQALAIFNPLAEQFPDFAIYSDRLGNALYELAKLDYSAAKDDSMEASAESALQSYQRALEESTRAVEAHQRIADRYPQDVTLRQHLRNDYFLKAWTIRQLAEFQEAALDHRGVQETAESLAELAPENADYLKLAGDLLAIAARAVDQQQPADAPSNSLQDRYAVRSIELLEAAVANGYSDRTGLKKELEEGPASSSLYDTLRQQPRFRQLLQALSP